MSSSDVPSSRGIWVLAAIALVALIGATVWWSQSADSPSGVASATGPKPEVAERVTPTKVTVNGKPVSGPPPVEFIRVNGKDGEVGFAPRFAQPPVEGQKITATLPGGGSITITPLEGAPPSGRAPASK